MLFQDVAVLVPLIAVGALDVADVALGQPPRQQALPAEVARDLLVETVQLLGLLGFLLHLERFRGLRLHAEGQLEGLNARFQVGVAMANLGVAPVDALQHVQLITLLVGVELLLQQVFDRLALDVLHFEACVADGGALIGARAETRSPSSSSRRERAWA